MVHALTTRWKKLAIVPLAALALGSAGGVAPNHYLVRSNGEDCCAPGAPCCQHHHASVALR